LFSSVCFAFALPLLCLCFALLCFALPLLLLCFALLCFCFGFALLILKIIIIISNYLKGIIYTF
tara:strand:- start:1381 stop:1572 length:192 start_codon:yes stop_codon:yes gene_type:complete